MFVVLKTCGLPGKQILFPHATMFTSLPRVLACISNIRHLFASLKSRIALQVVRKIAPCDRPLVSF